MPKELTENSINDKNDTAPVKLILIHNDFLLLKIFKPKYLSWVPVLD